MKYLICNLKANKTYEEILEYREEIASLKTSTSLILAPSNLYLSLFKGMNVNLCTQNIDLKEELCLTGDISIKQLKSVGTTYAIIGHYERKKYYQENEYDIEYKVKKALDHKLKVIYCIGETLEEKSRKVTFQVLERQIARLLNNIPLNELKNIILAYEPTYLIGNSMPYDIKEIEEVISFIKALVRDYYEVNIDIVFGGNINKNNISNFKNVKYLDGFIIGSSSLKPQNIKEILQIMSSF